MEGRMTREMEERNKEKEEVTYKFYNYRFFLSMERVFRYFFYFYSSLYLSLNKKNLEKKTKYISINNS